MTDRRLAGARVPVTVPGRAAANMGRQVHSGKGGDGCGDDGVRAHAGSVPGTPKRPRPPSDG
ncbi:hypothetical protein [Streptomyces marispadix]|uniref:Uncharacterized protein n=1 Tax=Streptomyces marispadix TaxID=2922868 RepID=A0ABS9SW03_9ACTN|nr:hypothetical protein [Streptomyces marispadix]MCH6160452.1 hypothetical protein [Streptomyces marispadix]